MMFQITFERVINTKKIDKETLITQSFVNIFLLLYFVIKICLRSYK